MWGQWRGGPQIWRRAEARCGAGATNTIQHFTIQGIRTGTSGFFVYDGGLRTVGREFAYAKETADGKFPDVQELNDVCGTLWDAHEPVDGCGAFGGGEYEPADVCSAFG